AFPLRLVLPVLLVPASPRSYGSAPSCIPRSASFWFDKSRFCGVSVPIRASSDEFCRVRDPPYIRVRACLLFLARLSPRLKLWRQPAYVQLLSRCCPKPEEANLQPTSTDEKPPPSPLA